MFNVEFKKDVEGISEEALKILQDYDWPGNVRELKNLIERAVIMEGKGVIEPEQLPLELFNKKRLGDILSLEFEMVLGENSFDDVEKIMVEKALALSGGNVSKAAKLLKISRDQLRYRLKKWSLSNET